MAEIDKVTEEHCVTYPDLLKDGKSVIKKFRTLMQFFRKCHRGYITLLHTCQIVILTSLVSVNDL